MLSKWRFTSGSLVSAHRCSAGCNSGEYGGRNKRFARHTATGPTVKWSRTCAHFSLRAPGPRPRGRRLSLSARPPGSLCAKRSSLAPRHWPSWSQPYEQRPLSASGRCLLTLLMRPVPSCVSSSNVSSSLKRDHASLRSNSSARLPHASRDQNWRVRWSVSPTYAQSALTPSTCRLRHAIGYRRWRATDSSPRRRSCVNSPKRVERRSSSRQRSGSSRWQWTTRWTCWIS